MHTSIKPVKLKLFVILLKPLNYINVVWASQKQNDQAKWKPEGPKSQ